MHTFQLLDTTLSLFSTAMRPGSYRRRPRLSREDLTHWAVKWLALLQDMGFFVEIPPDLPESLHAVATTATTSASATSATTVRQGTFYSNQYEPLPDADAGSEYITDTPGMDAGLTSDGQASWLRLRGCDHALPYTECGSFARPHGRDARLYLAHARSVQQGRQTHLETARKRESRGLLAIAQRGVHKNDVSHAFSPGGRARPLWWSRLLKRLRP